MDRQDMKEGETRDKKQEVSKQRKVDRFEVCLSPSRIHFRDLSSKVYIWWGKVTYSELEEKDSLNVSPLFRLLPYRRRLLHPTHDLLQRWSKFHFRRPCVSQLMVVHDLLRWINECVEGENQESYMNICMKTISRSKGEGRVTLQGIMECRFQCKGRRHRSKNMNRDKKINQKCMCVCRVRKEERRNLLWSWISLWICHECVSPTIHVSGIHSLVFGRRRISRKIKEGRVRVMEHLDKGWRRSSHSLRMTSRERPEETWLQQK
jgi:hypothetical protein